MDGGAAVLRDALAAALPDKAGGVARVEPDMVGEALLLSIWPTNDGDKRRALARVHADDPVAVGETVVRVCQDYVIRGHTHPMAWLQQICATTKDLGALLKLSQAMPTETVELREVMADLHTRIVDLSRTLPRTVEGLTLLSTALSNSSVSLSALGRTEEALPAIHEAVNIRRKLAAVHRDAYRPDLMGSINNLSNFLSDLGQRDEALAAIQEAVKLCRELAGARPPRVPPRLGEFAQQPIMLPIRAWTTRRSTRCNPRGRAHPSRLGCRTPRRTPSRLGGGARTSPADYQTLDGTPRRLLPLIRGHEYSPRFGRRTSRLLPPRLGERRSTTYQTSYTN